MRFAAAFRPTTNLLAGDGPAGNLVAGTPKGGTVTDLRYSDGIAAARTMLAVAADTSALQGRLPSGWELAPYAGDDLRGTSLRGANLLIPFHEVYAVRTQEGEPLAGLPQQPEGPGGWSR